MFYFFFQDFRAFDESFSSDYFDILDESLDDFISIKFYSMTPKPSFCQKMINVIYVNCYKNEKTKVVVHLHQGTPQLTNKPMIVVQGGSNPGVFKTPNKPL